MVPLSLEYEELIGALQCFTATGNAVQSIPTPRPNFINESLWNYLGAILYKYQKEISFVTRLMKHILGRGDNQKKKNLVKTRLLGALLIQRIPETVYHLPHTKSNTCKSTPRSLRQAGIILGSTPSIIWPVVLFTNRLVKSSS